MMNSNANSNAWQYIKNIGLAVSILILLVVGIFSAVSRITQTELSILPVEDGSVLAGRLPLPVPTGQATATAGANVVPSTVPPQVLVERRFGTWSFRATRSDDEGVLATIQYDDRSVAALKAYADANKVLAQTLAQSGGQAQVGITFRNYVAPDQFRTWAAANSLRVKESVLRATDANNLPLIMGIAAQEPDLLPQSGIDEQVSIFEREGSAIPRVPGSIQSPITLRGVFYVNATVDSDKLASLASDPLVFLVDVTPNIVRRELNAAHIANAERIPLTLHWPFAAMEHLGLEHFR